MSEMLDRVEAAIRDTMHREDDTDPTAPRRYAVAALKAMRDPTFEMRGAAQQAFIRPGGGTIASIWNAMIDSALA